jgi:predicted Zn-dependent protease
MPERSLSPRWQDSAFGPASAWVRQVVAGTGEAERLLARGTRRSRPADANKAVGYVLRALGLSGSSSIDPQERAKALDEFLLLRPASTCAMTLKAVHLAASGKSADAEELFRQALRQDPSNLPACVKLGEFLAAQRREDEALEVYERARHLEPQNSYISVAIAGIFSLHKPEDVALEKINALSAEFPDNRYLLAARATVYSRGKKHNEMLATVKEVVRLMPEDGIYRRILADQLKQLGRLDEAEVQLRDIITLRPADPEARLKLARFLAECRPEARDKAVEMAKQAMALASQQGSDTTAIQNLLDELEGR